MSKKRLKRLALVTVFLFLIGNFIVYNHVHRFTHFSETSKEKTKSPEQLNTIEKLKTLFLGISIPKPENAVTPGREYDTFVVQSNETLEVWSIEVPEDRGKIIMFHGYSSSKSDLIQYSEEFNKKGYSTFLVDFMGSGGSSGNLTTIGYEESQNVRAVYDYVKEQNPNDKIILFGCSMGAVSIMKSLSDFEISPDKVILECPFGSFRSTTKRRFEAMKLPSFPFADLLLIHGWIQLGFNPYRHNPVEYAKDINVPALLLYGKEDDRIPIRSIEEIYENIEGHKKLGILENSGHEVYLNNDAEDWNTLIDDFLMNK